MLAHQLRVEMLFAIGFVGMIRYQDFLFYIMKVSDDPDWVTEMIDTVGTSSRQKGPLFRIHYRPSRCDTHGLKILVFLHCIYWVERGSPFSSKSSLSRILTCNPFHKIDTRMKEVEYLNHHPLRNESSKV